MIARFLSRVFACKQIWFYLEEAMGFMKVWKTLLLSFVLLGTLVALESHAADAAAALKYEAAGNQLYQSNDFAKAIQYYQAALQMDPSRTASYVGLGNCQYQQGDKAGALASYDKALALDPSNAQLTQFANTLRGSAGAPSVSPMDPMKQATDLFTQKRYAEAIPLFEQAVAQDSTNAQAQYYWGYACAMTQDNRGAALHFYRFNNLTPNPGVQAYADRLKAGLSPADQMWVEAQLSGRTNALLKAKAPFKSKAIRLAPMFVMSSQKDLKTLAEAVTTYVGSLQTRFPTLSCDVTVPTGFMGVQLEGSRFFGPNLELVGVGGYYPVGNLKIAITEATYSNIQDMKFTAIIGGLMGRYHLGAPEKKLRPYIGLGLQYAMVSMKLTQDVTDTAYPENTGSVSATGTAGAIGFEFQLGLNYALGSSLKVGPVLGYRMLKAKDAFSMGYLDSPSSLDLGGPIGGLQIGFCF
jgi:tetratricopeptide (TPR) repeat protein